MKIINKVFFIILFSSCINQSKDINGKVENINSLDLEKSSEMLNEKKYWKIVSKSLINSRSENEQEDKLKIIISTLSSKEMIGFGLRTHKLLKDTYTSKMWCAGYLMNGGCSDDGFEYFRSWIISRGKEVFYEAKENPDNLISEFSSFKFEYEFENFQYVSFEPFKLKTGKDIHDYTDYKEFRLKEGNYPEIEINWYEDTPETMRRICPKLFDKFFNI